MPWPPRTARSSWRMRSGSASRSIAAIFPPLTVKPMTENGFPSSCRPARRRRSRAPARCRARPEKVGHLGRTANLARRPGPPAAASARSTTSGSSSATSRRSHRRARPRRRRRRPSLRFHVGVRGRGRSLDAAACAAGQLARRVRGPLDDGRDLLEGQVEDVVQHERDPLGRRQRLEHHEQREADRVGQQHLAARGPSGSSAVERPARQSRPAAPRSAIFRERSMSSDMRATTVVSHPPRLSTSLGAPCG